MRIILTNRAQAWDAIKLQLFPYLKEVLQAGNRYVLTIKPETRSESQNRLMWPLLTEFSKQLQWPVNGYMVTMTPEEWKEVLTAAFSQEEIRLATGFDGNPVMLGKRTSKFSKKQFIEWIEFLNATAADRGVKLPAYDQD